MHNPNHILLTGASGDVGRALHARLRLYWPSASIVCVSRSRSRAPFIRWDVQKEDPPFFLSDVQWDVILCLVDGEDAIHRLVSLACPHTLFVYTSSIVASFATFGWTDPYAKTKAHHENRAREQCFERNVACCVMRPGLVWDPECDTNGWSKKFQRWGWTALCLPPFLSLPITSSSYLADAFLQQIRSPSSRPFTVVQERMRLWSIAPGSACVWMVLLAVVFCTKNTVVMGLWGMLHLCVLFCILFVSSARVVSVV